MITKNKQDRSPEITVRRAAIDALEPRRMLATFNGTPGNDTINILVSGSNTHVVINGDVRITADLNITINAGDGNDAFTVQSTRAGSDITARGEQGNDSLVNPSLLDLDAVYLADFAFEGGTGVDTVVADNGHDSTTAANISIQFNRLSKGSFSLEFTGVEMLDYWDSNGSNRIGFTNLNPDPLELAQLRIHGNGGNDTIADTLPFAPDGGDWVSSFGSGGVFVDGGTGTDTIVLNNMAGGGNSRYEMDASTIRLGPSRLPLTYSACEAVDVKSNHLADSVHLNGKPGGTSLRYDGLDGNDTFNAGGGDLDSNGFLLSNTTLLGGPGNDSIRIDDRLDDQSDGTTSHYTFSSPSTFTNTLAKGAVGLVYDTFETQTLDLANALVSGLNTVPVVNLNATTAAITSTRLNGGPARSASVNVGNGSLSALSGTIHLLLHGGFLDRATISDSQAAGIANGYQVTDTFVRKGATNQTINYSGVTHMTLSASTVFDVVSVDSTAPGMSLNVFANGGNDIINVGNVDGRVTIDGGAGADSLTIAGGEGAARATQTLDGSTFTDAGLTRTFSAIEQLTIAEASGGADLSVLSIDIRTTIAGGSGDDSFDVGGGDINANIPGNGVVTDPFLVISGGGGNDAIRFDDRNDASTAATDIYQFQRTNGVDQLQRLANNQSHFVNWSGIEGVTLDASNVTSHTTFTTIVDIATPLRVNGNGGPDGIQVLDASAPVVVHTGLGDQDSILINVDLDAQPVMFTIDQSDDVDSLVINAGGTLRVTSGAVLAKTRLGSNPSLTINGVLDLAGGAFISRAGGPSLATFRDMLTAGRNGGTWNGAGASGAINSSLATASPIRDAVGYALGAQAAPSSIGPFTIAASDVLVQYALDGDANLDGSVNLQDFNRLAANFGLAGREWATSDANYDGTTNLIDFNALAGNFGLIAAPTTAHRLPNTLDDDDGWGGAGAWLNDEPTGSARI